MIPLCEVPKIIKLTEAESRAVNARGGAGEKGRGKGELPNNVYKA